MSDIDLIRALAATGTPAGRWRVSKGRDGSNWIDAGEYDEVIRPAPVDCMAYCYGGSSQIELTDDDAAKIVAAVNALPALADLIDAVDALPTVTMSNFHDRACGDPGCTHVLAGDLARTKAARDALVQALGVQS